MGSKSLKSIPPSTSALPSRAVEVPREPVFECAAFFASINTPEELSEVTGSFQSHEIWFYPDTPLSPGTFRYTALLGAEYGTKPGTVPLTIRGVRLDGSSFEEIAGIQVKTGEFPSEQLRVPPRTVTPTRKDLRHIERDRRLLAKIYATKTKKRFWDPPYAIPVMNPVTSIFGTSRVYNGKKQSVHLGTDLRAPTGTPIITPISGKVVVARPLFFTGNTVILDHGFGLFTIYGHLSKLKAKEGKLAKKGEIMGWSGMTGRASGPHLHWGANLHGVKVDPSLLMQILK